MRQVDSARSKLRPYASRHLWASSRSRAKQRAAVRDEQERQRRAKSRVEHAWRNNSIKQELSKSTCHEFPLGRAVALVHMEDKVDVGLWQISQVVLHRGTQDVFAGYGHVRLTEKGCSEEMIKQVASR